MKEFLFWPNKNILEKNIKIITNKKNFNKLELIGIFSAFISTGLLSINLLIITPLFAIIFFIATFILFSTSIIFNNRNKYRNKKKLQTISILQAIYLSEILVFSYLTNYLCYILKIRLAVGTIAFVILISLNIKIIDQIKKS